MASLLLRKQSFLCFILAASVLLLGQIYNVTGVGVKPEIRFYFNEAAKGDALLFENHQPNLGDYAQLFPRVKYICAKGWYVQVDSVCRCSTGINYTNQYNAVGTKFQYDNIYNCISKTSTIQSFRYWGSNETTTDGLSLYPGKTYTGDEFLVEGQAYTGISTPILSLAATGKSDWKLFEGIHLDGKSVCIEVPKLGEHYYYTSDIRTSLNLTTIGSVFKGCNVLKIEEYKRENNLMQT